MMKPSGKKCIVSYCKVFVKPPIFGMSRCMRNEPCNSTSWRPWSKIDIAMQHSVHMLAHLYKGMYIYISTDKCMCVCARVHIEVTAGQRELVQPERSCHNRGEVARVSVHFFASEFTELCPRNNLRRATLALRGPAANLMNWNSPAVDDITVDMRFEEAKRYSAIGSYV